VLDLTGEIGQFAGRCFAELGAEVIKIEPPEGDPVRRIGPFVHDEPKPDRSLLWFTLNASKKGVTCSLTHDEGRALLRKLIAQADLVIESYQPGYLQSIGIDQEELRREHPKLVWVSVTGFGQDGPYRDYKWSDLVGQALGGLLYLWGVGLPSRPRRAGLLPRLDGCRAERHGCLYHARRTGAVSSLTCRCRKCYVRAGWPGGVSGYWSRGDEISRAAGRITSDISSRTIYACKEGCRLARCSARTFRACSSC
jgi:hypothetical protein